MNYHHGNLRRELLDRAAQVIAKQGIENLSLRGLAQDLGVSHGAPARHFKDKLDLLRALATEGHNKLADYVFAAAEAAGPDPLERYAALGRAFVRFSLEYPAYYQATRHPEVAAHADQELRAASRRRWWYCDAKHPGSPEVDEKIEFRGSSVALRPCAGEIPARSANSVARRIAIGRLGDMVTDHQGGRHQRGVITGYDSWLLGAGFCNDRCNPTKSAFTETDMKVGVLQFFGWRDRSVPLRQIYDMALERIAVMDTTGYDAVWLAEHHFSGFSVCPSVHVMGTMAAARTKRLRIGTAVSLAPFYNPLRLAEEVALLDVLSGGRVNWGAGRGFERSEFEAFGIAGEESVSRFHETVDIVLKAWTNEKLSYEGKYYRYDAVEVLPKPLQAPHPPTWMAATSVTAIEWAAANGFSILMDPHSSRAELARKRRHYAEKLAAAGSSESGRTIPMARLIAIDETAEKAHDVARRAAQWTVASYAGPSHGAHRQEVRTFDGKDPIAFYLEDVILHGTPEAVADQIRALETEARMGYLMAAPLSRRSFTMLTDKVLPKIAG